MKRCAVVYVGFEGEGAGMSLGCVYTKYAKKNFDRAP